MVTITNATKGIIQQIFLATINKLDLVTREEFATQTQVLIKTRLRIEQLENKLAELQEKDRCVIDAK
ncbi:MAG TPA: accessory factor UbiK family protein [Gammaproteobacteria bacterium]|nr:accessory factor UbiK family protein [Gammaproteobacteria bacterium]